MSAQHDEEDYGDYVTRCICGFTHDDGYMICCDQCSVWQHVECMKVNPKNLPDKYLCEECEPRPVDKKRARAIQLKKKDDISDFDEDDSSSERANSSLSRPGSTSPHPPSMKKKKKAQRTSSGGTLRVHELKAEARRNRKEKGEKEDVKKSFKKKSKHHHHQHSLLPSQSLSGPHPPTSMMSGLQTLLTAASALEEQQQKQQAEKNEKSFKSIAEPLSSNLFNCTTVPWKDPYKTIVANVYTEALRHEFRGCLEELKKEAVVYTKDEYNSLGSFPLCLVRDVGDCRKGLVAEAHIPEDEMILEYKSKITTKELLCEEMFVPDLLLWKESPCPFVFQYDRISGVCVCLDARELGNTARFIRRSCSPNAELRHFFVNDDVHFGVYALNHISPEEEVTLPFDFPYDKCDYVVECACGKRSNACHLLKKMKKSKKDIKGVVSVTKLQEKESVHGEPQSISKKIMKSRVQMFQVDEDSNSSWASTGSSSRRKVKRTFSQSSISQQPSRDATDSEPEDLDSELARKRKSREERKTEAVWKMFEKMEARGRKKLSSTSDNGNSEENTNASSQVTCFVPKADNKERRFSSSSRKVNLLPPIKHQQLPSVSSSNEFWSPDNQDAFSSPPLTPSLSFVPQPNHNEATPQQLDSPTFLPSPFSDPPKLTFEVTPYLHPKYLLADFVLPRKKAILRQWEMEQKEMLMRHEAEDGSDWMVNGFAMACMKAMEGNKPRLRGCLKHRWIDMHNKQIQSESDNLKLPFKRRFLQKWIEDTSLGIVSPTSLTPPPSSSPSPPLLNYADDSKTVDNLSIQLNNPSINYNFEFDKTPTCSPSRCNTEVKEALFDDFSDDDDFEDLSEHHERSYVEENRKCEQPSMVDTHHSDIDQQDVKDDDGRDNLANEEGTSFLKKEAAYFDSALQSHLGVTNDIQCQADSKNSLISFESISPEPIESMVENEGALAASSSLPEVHIQCIDQGETEQQDTFDRNQLMHKELSDEEETQESIEMEISSPQVSVSFEQQGFAFGEEEMSKSSDLYTDGDEKISTSSDVTSKPSAKKKMSLLEYRSRSRKPSEQLQCRPSLDSGQIPEPMTSSTPPPPSSSPSSNRPGHSFLLYSSSFLRTSTSSRVTKPFGESVSSPISGASVVSRLMESNVPQFEPVSPDDGDKITAMDDVSLIRPSSLPSLPPPPPPPPPPNVPPSSMSYSHTAPPNVPPNGGQQVLWGNRGPHVAANLEITHDPRRAQPPSGVAGPNQDVYIPCPPGHQSSISPHYTNHPPLSLPRPHHSTVPYTSMQQVPGQPQIRTAPMLGLQCGPHTSGDSSYAVQQQPRMPHPPLLHQPSMHHHPTAPGNTYFQ